MKRKFVSLLAAVMALRLIFTGCGEKTVKLSRVESDEMQFAAPAKGDTVATIKTSEGDIKVVLYPRYVEDFIIQTGDPRGDGGNSIWELPFSDEFSDKLHHYTGALSMANSGSDTNRSQFFIVTSQPKGITDEVVALMEEAGWREGIIETYKQSGGAPNLDYRYTVFGQVYEGLEVAFAINGVKTDEDDRPKEDIVIETIEIEVIE